MKKFGLFLGLMLVLLGGAVAAREKALVKIGSMQQKGKDVAFAVVGSQYFRIGGNIYVLHIGEREFAHGRVSKSNGKGTVTYYIPLAEFNKLQDGTNVYLTYGRSGHETEQKLEGMSKEPNFPCWLLGKLSKEQLVK